jgi:hypothetical protein
LAGHAVSHAEIEPPARADHYGRPEVMAWCEANGVDYVYGGFRKDGRYGVGKALQAIDHGKKNVLDPAVLQFVHDPQPEPGAFVLLKP